MKLGLQYNLKSYLAVVVQKTRFYHLLFLLSFGGCLSNLSAQNTPTDSITRLDEIVLQQPQLPKSALGITPSVRIGKTTFENYNPVDIAASVNQIAGVYFLSGALNTNRITIRGVGSRTPFGTDAVRLYFNGIPVTDGTGFSTIETFDLENVASIEVIKGPKGTGYGGNLGGAILLNTLETDKENIQLTNAFTVGSFNQLKNNIGFNYSDADWQLQFHYGHFETDGFRQNNRFERDGFLLNTAVKLDTKSNINLLVNYVDYSAQIPSAINQTDFEEDPTRAAPTWLAAQGFEDNRYTLIGIGYERTFGASLKNSTSVFYTYLDHFEARPFNILDEFTNGFGFRSVFEGELGAKSKYHFGAEFYRDEHDRGTFENLFEENNGNGSLQGNRLSDNKEFRRQFSAFATLSQSLGKRFTAQIELNLNQSSYDFRDLFNLGSSNGSARRDFDPILLPNLGLSYRTAIGEFYANISRGFSNPSLEETLTPDGVVNPDINQETGTNYEVGGNFSLAKNALRLNWALYRLNVNNLLVADRIDEDQFIGRNAGTTRQQGVELDVSYNWAVGTNWTFAPYLSYTFNDHNFVEFIDGDNNFSGNPLTGVPAHRINSGINLRHSKGFRFTLTHQYVSDIPLNDANTQSSDPFTVIGSQLRYKAQLFKSLSLGLNFGVDNLLNTNYARSVWINAVAFGGGEPRFFFPGNRRNFFGGVQLDYQF